MRRSRWAEDDEKEEVRDEPVTLTEKQYRALKRGALFGMLGLVLGVVAVGLAAWSLARTPGHEANPPMAQAAQPAEAVPAADTVAAATPSPMPSMIPSPTPVAAKPPAPARKATSTRRAAAPDATTEKPQPQPASSVLGDTPTPPAPTPVQAEPVQPVGGSDSGH